jgi:hypothetical protein
MEVVLIALASIAFAIQKSLREEREMPGWLFYGIWGTYMSRFENVDLPDSWLVRRDQQLERNELPLTLIPQSAIDVDAGLFADAVLGGGGEFLYIPTDGELGWLDFVRRRYAIANALEDMLVEYEGPNGESIQVLFLDTFEAGLALGDDGVDRAPMLSEDTLLQRILFFIGPIEREDDD